MTTDYRALCAELAQQLDDALDFTVSSETRRHMKALVANARAALSQPEPEGLTHEELLDLTDYGVAAESIGPLVSTILTRYARPTIKPVPVSERLPGPEDCDAEGRCWLRGNVEGGWRLMDPSNTGVPQLKYCFSHWLPHYALCAELAQP